MIACGSRKCRFVNKLQVLMNTKGRRNDKFYGETSLVHPMPANGRYPSFPLETCQTEIGLVLRIPANRFRTYGMTGVGLKPVVQRAARGCP